TRRRCTPNEIAVRRRILTALAHRSIHYIPEGRNPLITADRSSIDTDFFVDHSTLDTKLRNAIQPGKPWLLGPIDEGWEWFAFTFREQEQFGLTTQEVEEMIAASSDVAKHAYSRMTLDEDHQWLRHTESEVNQIIAICHLRPGDKVLDLGCG